jgi:hypothetical protein
VIVAKETVAQMWQSFRSQVMDADCQPEQVREMRLAFYAGATAVLTVFDAIGTGAMTVRESRETLVALWDELERFNDEHAGLN